MEDGPSKTYPAPDLENMEEVIKKDSINPQSNRVVRPNSEFIFWDDMWNESDENGR